MNKLLALTTTPEKVFGNIVPPAEIQPLTSKGGAGGLGLFLSNVIGLIFVIAGLLFVIMTIISAVQWILSGGDKEAVANARKRLTYAIIGITLLSLSFVIFKVIQQITGFKLYGGQ